jgi:hypothetical protein
MNLYMTFVLVMAIFLVYRVLMFALRRKGDLRAGGSIGKSAFYLEVHDRRDGHSLDRRRRTDAQDTQLPSSG